MDLSSSDDPTRLFVADIPLQATMSETIRAFERFGRVRSVIFCSSKGPHLGQAVVHFFDSMSGSMCLERARRAANDLNVYRIEIRGSPVSVVLQNWKDELLHNDEHRNLSLTSEGLALDFGGDLPRRRRMLEQKREKLNDPSYRVSDHCVIVSNLPSGMQSGDIRRLFTSAPGRWVSRNRGEELAKRLQGPVRIRDVTRHPHREDQATVDFVQADHALAAVREVSGNPTYFPDRRLIVEFALEKAGHSRSARSVTVRNGCFREMEPPVRDRTDVELE